jgi:hypothetical protein
MMSQNFWLRSVLSVLWLGLLVGCIPLSNQAYVEQHLDYRGIRRVAVFVRRWPCYQQLAGQNFPGASFIGRRTVFYGPWEAAKPVNPRAVDVQDIDDGQITELLLRTLQAKGYQPVLSGVVPSSLESVTAENLMANYQAMDQDVDAFLFCFYSPVLYVADPQFTPEDHWQRSYSLTEVMAKLAPGSDYVIWAGPRSSQALKNSISHAFIYVSLTMFRALDWRPFWETADSQVGGRFRVAVAQCLPGPTDEDYRADAGIIQRLMYNNLKCRLRHLIPDAF